MIKHISYLKDGKRETVSPGPTGLFSVRVPATSPAGYPSFKDLQLTAAGFVKNEAFKQGGRASGYADLAPIVPTFAGLTSNVTKVTPPVNTTLPPGPVTYDDDDDDPNNGLYDYDYDDDYYDYD